MADVNAPSGQTLTMAPPVRADDQILPHIRWVPIGKSNCYLDLEKSQSNPIYKIADTILYDKKAGCYKCQLDEQWFDLTKETLREALQITSVNSNQAFFAPPSIDGLIDFVSQLGYPKLVMNLSTVVSNDLFQPWRALLIIINLCLTGKTSGFERPRALVLQILWGIVTRANIDYAERIWEEFTQSIHTFIEDKRNLSRHTSGKKRATLTVIPSIRFTKMIIHHLQRKHRRSPKSVGASEAEEVPAEEPQVADEDTNYQKAVEESMKDAYALPKGPLPQVVIREPKSGKYQPLPELPVKGKAKVTEEHVAHDLLGLQKEKKTSPTDQYIFQRRVSKPTASSFHDESPYEAGPDPDAQAKDQTGSDAGAQAEGQAGSNLDETSEGQAGSNLDEISEGQAGPDPGNVEARTKGLLQRSIQMYKQRGITKLKPQDLEGPAYEIVKVFHPDVIHLQYQMEECHKLLINIVDDPILRHNISKPLPLGGPPGEIKAAYYPDAGLEQMVLDQFWIEEECKYDIAAITVRTHMRILTVVRIEVFSMYGYDYMKKIVLRQVNLTKPQWTAMGFEYKHDYTIIESPRAVIFRDKYEVQMMMRFNEIHKFSDGTLQQIVEALDYRVKEFRINMMNPCLNTRFWTRKDVDRCNMFMFAIQRHLRTRRIFRNLESFIRGRVREGDYRLLRRTD
nr:hypothetical protein [Tanacetum cinerariifolium]